LSDLFVWCSRALPLQESALPELTVVHSDFTIPFRFLPAILVLGREVIARGPICFPGLGTGLNWGEVGN
jgi:hypothetical protein